MAQKCVVVARVNPSNREEPAKYYALAKSNRNVTMDEICRRVSERSSYSRGELHGCITEFLIEVVHVLEEGNIAELSTLGNFSLRARTLTPTATAEEFKASNIRDAWVRFYPGEELRNLCKTVSFEIERSKSDSGSSSTEPDTDDGEEGGGGL